MMNVQRLKQSCQAQQNPDLKDGVILELIEMLESAEKEAAENLKGAVAWQQRAETAVPDGWKLVPVNAFPSQWAAGQKAFESAGINKVDAVYKAMVAAAPEVE